MKVISNNSEKLCIAALKNGSFGEGYFKCAFVRFSRLSEFSSRVSGIFMQKIFSIFQEALLT